MILSLLLIILGSNINKILNNRILKALSFIDKLDSDNKKVKLEWEIFKLWAKENRILLINI